MGHSKVNYFPTQIGCETARKKCHCKGTPGGGPVSHGTRGEEQGSGAHKEGSDSQLSV